MPTPAIQCRLLGKVYRAKGGEVVAVEKLDLEVAPAQIFGLLGPNGAGKTTTIRMLCGLIRPTTGEAFVDGHSVLRQPLDVRRSIGLVPEDAGDHRNLTLQEELDYYGSLYALDRQTVRRRSGDLLDRLGLGERRHHRLRGFSLGMRRKFHLVRALLHEPRVLLLDEPTSGLDPAVVEEVWSVLKTLVSERQTTVILCSHHLEEVERLCQRVAILRRRLLVEGPLAELRGASRRFRVELAADAATWVEALASVPGVHDVSAQNHRLRFGVTGEPSDVLPRGVRALVEAGAPLIELIADGRDLRTLYRSIVQDAPGTPGAAGAAVSPENSLEAEGGAATLKSGAAR